MPALTADAIDRTLRRIDGELRTAEATLDVLQAVTNGITRLVPADVWRGVVLDPSTLLDTGGQHRDGFPETTMPRLFEIEHIEQDDVDSLRALARRPDPASLLSDPTGGDLAASKVLPGHPAAAGPARRAAGRVAPGRPHLGGCWSCAARPAAPMTAVAIGPAGPGDLAAIVLDAYGLSQRER